jgi:hypothetical protein
VTAILAETACTLRRLARRRTVSAAAGLDALVLLYAGVLNPVRSASGAVSAAVLLATLTLLVVSSGIVADDRVNGSLAVAATHPATRATWVLGRWIAVLAVGAAVFSVGAAVLLGVAGGPGRPVAAVGGVAAGLAHLAALAALAVALSCVFGPTAQLLLLLGVLVAGAMPPAAIAETVGAAWAADVARVVWGVLPAPWSLARLEGWWVGGGASAPLVALALPLQTAAWLGAGAAAMARAELGVRSA